MRQISILALSLLIFGLMATTASAAERMKNTDGESMATTTAREVPAETRHPVVSQGASGNPELRANVQSSQLDGEERDANSCYQAARSMKESGAHKQTVILPKNPKVPDDKDGEFSVYSTRESQCVVLENNGANDLAWGLGDQRYSGCACSLVMSIR